VRVVGSAVARVVRRRVVRVAVESMLAVVVKWLSSGCWVVVRWLLGGCEGDLVVKD
jgi:hypothetical protein